MQQDGRIVILGTGIMLGAHLTPVAKSHLQAADVVFAAVTDGISEQWLQTMNADVRSFAPLYALGKSRHDTYQQMIDLMLTEVRAGKFVVGAFYGHPGVFAYAPHKVIELARQEGYEAQMLAGISAADCLHADLGIDPGRVGCQYYEASQFMFYQRVIDPSAYLVLWQITLAGDRSIARFDTGVAELQLLVELLAEHYPASHRVVIYEAASMPFETPRMDWIALADLPNARLTLKSTLILPPAKPLQKNARILAQLATLQDS
jgi:uncharacterized protein YabN with tetrapyrrole methylase and pyrophosphatase domain